MASSVPPATAAVAVLALAAWLAATGASHLDPPPDISTASITIPVPLPIASTIATSVLPTTPPTTISTSPPAGFDLDLDLLKKVEGWYLYLKRDNCGCYATVCWSVQVEFVQPVADLVRLTVSQDGQGTRDHKMLCTKKPTGLLECTDLTEPPHLTYHIIPLATDYENYLVLGLNYRGAPIVDMHTAAYWLSLHASDTPRPQDLQVIEQLLKGVTDDTGLPVDVLHEAGILCWRYPNKPATIPTFPPPVTTTNASTDSPVITSVPITVSCPKKNRVQDLDIARYSGSWHDVMVMKAPPEPTEASCTTHVFAWASNVLAYFEKTYDIRAALYTTWQGQALALGPFSHGLIDLVLPSGQRQTYAVVDTDYDSYSVIISCSMSADGVAREKVRVLGRRYWLGAASRSKVNGVLRVLGINSPVVMNELDTRACLPDTCLGRGPAVQNFEPRQFAGTWYLVKWLEVPEGPIPECETYLNAAAVNGSIFLQKTDVRNSFSRSAGVEAVAVDRLSGEGRFMIQSYPGASATHIDVLHVVYDSWALISLCEEAEEGHPGGTARNYLRIVSRSRDPSKFPEKEITDVLREVDLDLTSFESVPVSFDVCGAVKCPVDIPSLDKFDRSKFQGLWVVLEETPSEVTTGFCTRHIFSKGRMNKMTLEVHQFNSDGESLANRTYDLDTPDPTSGRFTAADAPSRGKDIYDSYWILDTDYKEFAVVYSCSDRTNGWNNARTWVLGRTTAGLGHAATMRVLDVLTNSYVDTRLLKPVDHQFAPCPPLGDHSGPDDSGGGPPPGGPGSGARRLAAHAGLLTVCAAGLFLVGIHVRDGMRILGLETASTSRPRVMGAATLLCAAPSCSDDTEGEPPSACSAPAPPGCAGLHGPHPDADDDPPG